MHDMTIPSLTTSGCGHATSATTSFSFLSVSLLITDPKTHTTPTYSRVVSTTALTVPRGIEFVGLLSTPERFEPAMIPVTLG